MARQNRRFSVRPNFAFPCPPRRTGHRFPPASAASSEKKERENSFPHPSHVAPSGGTQLPGQDVQGLFSPYGAFGPHCRPAVALRCRRCPPGSRSRLGFRAVCWLPPTAAR